MSSSPDLRPPRPGLTFALRFLLAGLLVVVVVGTVIATTIQQEAESIVTKFASSTPESDQAKKALSDVERGKPQTILLIGNDARKGEKTGSRSDTMILVRLDPKAKVTSMLSLPRDLIIQDDGTSARLNASFAGGPGPLIDRLKRVLSTPEQRFDIHHYVSIKFTAFSEAVNAFGCFYADVDRRYFNNNSPPTGGGEPYATIDVSAGYQRLCGLASLDYVRFRHADNDLVREARQSHYLTEARVQIATSSLLTEQDKLASAILKFVGTDIRSTRGLLGVLSLAVDVVDKATKRVELETKETTEGALSTTRSDLAKAADEFLHPKAAPSSKPAAKTTKKQPSSKAKKGKRKSRSSKARTPKTLMANPSAVRALVRDSDIPRNFTSAPIYVPRLMESQARYVQKDSRGYDIQSRNQTFPWQGYRIVVYLAGGGNYAGQYYGIQGTSWKNPPILKLATDEVRLAGRTYKIEYDGSKIRRMLWQTPKGTYWVNNSLNNGLSNAEMRAIARSLVRYDG